MKITDKNKKEPLSLPKMEPTISLPKPKRKKKWGLFVALGILVVVLGGVGFVVFKGVQVLQKIGLKIDSTSLSLSTKDPELQKDSTGKYTNFLIIGIDTRPTSGGLNTDTIMEVSYNYDTNSLVMVSIPRDLSVEIGEGSGWYNKVNSVYAYAEQAEEESGLKTLQSTVEKITGTEIQYYAMVNYDAFVSIVDSVGGIDVNVPESFTDTCYPADSSSDTGSHYTFCIDSYGWWKTVSFKTGVQTMDGKTALEYARSRHGTYASGEAVLDYGRAAHQQQVLLALKNKVLSTDTLTSPKAIMNILASVSDNVKISSFTISDIQAALNLAKNFNDNNGKSSSFVLDPEVGNGQVVSNQNTYDENGVVTAYLIGPKLGMGKYAGINEYIKLVLAKPTFYSEAATIYVYNIGLGYQETSKQVQALKTQYPYTNIVFGGTLYSDKEGNYIYTHEDTGFTASLDEFATTLSITNKTKPDFITTNLNGEDVTILLGKTVTTTAQ